MSNRVYLTPALHRAWCKLKRLLRNEKIGSLFGEVYRIRGIPEEIPHATWYNLIKAGFIYRAIETRVNGLLGVPLRTKLPEKTGSGRKKAQVWEINPAIRVRVVSRLPREKPRKEEKMRKKKTTAKPLRGVQRQRMISTILKAFESTPKNPEGYFRAHPVAESVLPNLNTGQISHLISNLVDSGKLERKGNKSQYYRFPLKPTREQAPPVEEPIPPLPAAPVTTISSMIEQLKAKAKEIEDTIAALEKAQQFLG